MMWKALIFLAVASVVLTARVKKHETSYKFHVQHDYDYAKHKEVHHEPEKKEQEQNVEEQPQEEKKEEEQNQEQGEQAEQKKEEETQDQGDQSNNESQEPEDHDKHGFSAYEILYKVKDPYTHDYKGLHEKKYGDELKGAYWLLQPDGYKRTVNYHVDKHNGFHAEVEYSKPEEHSEEESEIDNESKKLEEKNDEHHHHVPKSEYYVSIHHGLKKPTPIVEENQEQENQEQENQESSAVHFPIYVV